MNAHAEDGLWELSNAFDFPDEKLQCGEVILDTEHGAVLTAGGILQLTGSGKIGKSMLLLNIAYGLAMGRDTLGFRIDRPRRVLYLNGENSQRTMQQRLGPLREYFCIDAEQVGLTRQNLLFNKHSLAMTLPKEGSMLEARRNLADLNAEVLIIDPLKNFFHGEENSADDMRRFMQAVRQLVQEFRFAVIIVHHTGKRQNEDTLYSGRGSSLLADDAETTAAFRKDPSGKGRFILSVTGRNCDEFSRIIMRQPERWFLYNLADKPVAVPDHMLIEILDALPLEFSTGEFHEAAGRKGASSRTADRRIREALDYRLLEKVKLGWFRVLRSTPATPDTKGLAVAAERCEGQIPEMPCTTTGTPGGVDDLHAEDGLREVL